MIDYFRLDHHYLINSLKSVVEGLLATHSTDVWSTYGGLNRVTKEVEKILYHGLRSTQVFCLLVLMWLLLGLCGV